MYLYAVSDSVHISLHINKSQQQTYRHPLILLTGNHARTKTLARMCNLCLVIISINFVDWKPCTDKNPS